MEGPECTHGILLADKSPSDEHNELRPQPVILPKCLGSALPGDGTGVNTIRDYYKPIRRQTHAFH
jgi:hypothetical protein